MSEEPNSSDTANQNTSTPDPSQPKCDTDLAEKSASRTVSSTSTGTDKQDPKTQAADTALVNNLAAQNISLNTGHEFYIFFTDPKIDRDRLIAQSLIFGDYLETHAYRFVGRNLNKILDLGCGEGLLTATLKRLYPQAHVIGLDFDSAAIEAARQKQDVLPIAGDPVEFVVGNAQGELPGGPYDLAYVSMMLLDSADPRQILQNVKKAIRPAGYLWVKDVYPDFLTSVDDPNWLQLGTLIEEAMKKVGRKVGLGPDLAQMFVDLDFADIRISDETYTISEESMSNRIMLGVALGAFRNAIPAVAEIQGLPEEELVQAYNQLAQDAHKLRGTIRFANVVARRTGNFIPS